MKALESEKPDNKMAFFNSLLPHVNKFDDNDFLEFQKGVLQVVAQINEKKMVSPPPQLYPESTSKSSHSQQFSAPPNPSFYSQSPQFSAQLPSNNLTPLINQPHSFSSQFQPFTTPTYHFPSQRQSTSSMNINVNQRMQLTAQYGQDVGSSSGVTSPETDSRDTYTPNSQNSSTAESFDFTSR